METKSKNNNIESLESDLQIFCNIVKNRSEENNKAIKLLVSNELYSTAISILRFELDSMIRVLYLLSCSPFVREHHLKQFFQDQRWEQNGKYITDSLMVKKAVNLHGWASKVYGFACAFIHLSYYHDYYNDDPFSRMDNNNLDIIKNYMIEFHEFNKDKTITFNSLKPYMLDIFHKINGNLECYIEDLETNPSQKIIY